MTLSHFYFTVPSVLRTIVDVKSAHFWKQCLDSWPRYVTSLSNFNYQYLTLWYEDLQLSSRYFWFTIQNTPESMMEGPSHIFKKGQD